MDNAIGKENKNWLDTPLSSKINLNKNTSVFLIIFIVAIISRFYLLGLRVMSHDEINHVYFAYQFYNGGEYVHNPITHGPLQFHLLELSYFLFNASDFSARLPAAFFSLITILFTWKFKRYLGKTGAIAAAALFTISPFMLYYGRYARNEAIAVFFSLATAWAVLRYLDNGENKFFYLTAGLTALHFATKETAFIFTAQLMIFLGLLFIYRISKLPWKKPNIRYLFLILLLVTVLLLLGLFLIPGNASQEITEEAVGSSISQSQLVLIAAAIIVFAVAFVFLLIGYGWSEVKNERSFGMILFQLTLVLPQLAAFPAFWAKLPVTEYTNLEAVGQVSQIMAVFIIISIAAGGAWKPREWLIGAGIFYGIYFVFYTSIFSNLGGVYSGLIGSLGYWLEQHGIERGSQPWYYFILIQLPLYEYLAVIGTFITGIYSTIWAIKRSPKEEFSKMLLEDETTHQLSKDNSRRIGLALLLFFSVTSIPAYMVVGEKMPWLTVHTSWAMWLVTGWLFGKLIKSLDWKKILTPRGLIATSSAITSIVTLAYAATMWIQPVVPFSGSELAELEVTGTFLFLVLIIGASIFTYFKSSNPWQSGTAFKYGVLTILFLLSALTIRHAALASFVNYDEANEYLVYAHAARGPKDALEEIESISLRLTGGKDLMVGYDNHTAYPFCYYLRDYPNRLEFGENPTRDLRNYSIILAGDANYHLIDPIVQDDYIYFDYLRMVWPNQDYFDLNFYKNYLSNPESRSAMLNAIFQVWLNRNYQPYGEVTQQDMSLRKWNPSQNFRMYIRKDVAAQVWQYGASTGLIDINEDPYSENKITLSPAQTIKDLGLQNPKGISVAPDGSIYIADTGNNRIIHLSEDHILLGEWGSEGSDFGKFNQPWDVAVGHDGSVFIADTWNHRIQKFTSTGDYIASWGVYGQAESPEAFWGPRGLTIDPQGNLLITDTGNKRVVVFSSDGEFIEEFGTVGYQLGEFDEPVGIEASPVTNMLYVADTWNQRVQVFEYIQDFGYTPSNSWDIDGWYGQSLENKPFITADSLNRVIVADPEAGRMLVFSNDGSFIHTFGDYDPFGPTGFGIIGGIASDSLGGLWVTDSLKNEIKYFNLP
jgi:predicted membrane-bound mannosyltransferase/DNA-binding beta-propeller fold protein YncE